LSSPERCSSTARAERGCVPLKALPPGIYKASWHFLSMDALRRRTVSPSVWLPDSRGGYVEDAAIDTLINLTV
jgi:hypothetical protein